MDSGSGIRQTRTGMATIKVGYAAVRQHEIINQKASGVQGGPEATLLESGGALECRTRRVGNTARSGAVDEVSDANEWHRHLALALQPRERDTRPPRPHRLFHRAAHLPSVLRPTAGQVDGGRAACSGKRRLAWSGGRSTLGIHQKQRSRERISVAHAPRV